MRRRTLRQLVRDVVRALEAMDRMLERRLLEQVRIATLYPSFHIRLSTLFIIIK